MKTRLTVFVLFVLSLSGCASTCDFEQTLVFMQKNKFEEICMIMHEPAELAGQEFCFRKSTRNLAGQHLKN